MKRFSAPSALFAIGIGFAAMCGAAGSGIASATDELPQVRYEVSGGSGVADSITYQTEEGQLRETNVTLPWSTEFTAEFGGEVLVLSAQGGGTISCRILIDGDVVSNETAAGQPARTVCTH